MSSFVKVTVFINRHLVKAAVFLLPLLGVTWIVGILAVNDDTVVFAWIFTILNSLQVMPELSNISNY